MTKKKKESPPDFLFNRMELAGSFGDPGTLLPLSIGMILINNLSATNVFCAIGLFYILTGLYFRDYCNTSSQGRTIFPFSSPSGA
ncbi:MAG: putative sulfate/molybdate transporter [Pseudomonadota bacterium]